MEVEKYMEMMDRVYENTALINGVPDINFSIVNDNNSYADVFNKIYGTLDTEKDVEPKIEIEDGNVSGIVDIASVIGGLDSGLNILDRVLPNNKVGQCMCDKSMTSVIKDIGGKFTNSVKTVIPGGATGVTTNINKVGLKVVSGLSRKCRELMDSIGGVTKTMVAIVGPIMAIVGPIVAVIGAFFLLIGIINKICGTTLSATGLIFGAMFAIVDIIYNAIVWIINKIITGVQFLINSIIGIFAFFVGAIGKIIGTILSIVQAIASKFDKIFKTNIADGLQGSIDNMNSIGDHINSNKVSFDTIEYKNIGDTFNKGNEFGTNVQNNVVSNVKGMVGGGSESGDSYDYSNSSTEYTTNYVNDASSYEGTSIYGPNQSSYGGVSAYEISQSNYESSDNSVYIEESRNCMSIISENIQYIVDEIRKSGIKNNIIVNNEVPITVKTFNGRERNELVEYINDKLIQSVSSGIEAVAR